MDTIRRLRPHVITDLVCDSRTARAFALKSGPDNSGVHPQLRHALKHSIATYLLDAGAELRFVQDWRGHSNTQTTVIYTRLVSRSRTDKAWSLFLKTFETLLFIVGVNPTPEAFWMWSSYRIAHQLFVRAFQPFINHSKMAGEDLI